ncbi:MAG: ATP-binding protein [Erysipelotrichaceae bacterium]|nr:ATP-binding protein [Erysipelotrichaceae bacterium]
MIMEVRVKNCFSFDEDIALSLEADMRNKKFSSNDHSENHFNILKTVGIYGPNNTGKTCLVKCIREIKNILLNRKTSLIPNIFADNAICELGITFLYEGKKYAYDFKFNYDKEEFIYERFAEIQKDPDGNEKENVWFLKDDISGEANCLDQDVCPLVTMLSKNNLFMYMIDVSKFEHLQKMKNILVSFAEKIDVINMNNIPLQHTIELMKNKDSLQDKVVAFIRNADLYLDNFEYVDMERLTVKIDGERIGLEEKVLATPDQIMDQIRLVSTYKGKQVPSMLFDSTGTKKIAALASYIIQAIDKGRILVIDELDSSIHFKLTRAIVAMFNNELNTDAQMIFTAHDINLLDCKRLFRKEQIWFVHKDNDGVYLYSLADFNARQRVNDTTDIIEKYKKGALCALPDPELINSLLSIKEKADG